jgi:hypothetical protein
MAVAGEGKGLSDDQRMSWPWLLPVAVASILAVVQAVIAGEVLHDDCYITLTYARNIAAGNGFVYNGGEPCLGTTTPLCTLWFALVKFVLPTADLPQVARMTGTVCWIASGWLIVAFRRHLRLSAAEAGLVAAAIVAAGNVRFIGMESPAFVAMVMLIAGMLARCLRAGAGAFDLGVVGLLVGLAQLVRGEGALLGAIAAATQYLHARRVARWGRMRALWSTWPLAVGFALVLGAWAAYALPTFGHVLPDTLEVKQLQASSRLFHGFRYMFLCEWLPNTETQFRLGEPGYLNPWFVLAAAGAVIAATKRRRLLPLPVFAMALLLGYSLLGVSGYHWYVYPVWQIAHALAALALARLLERVFGARAVWSQIAVATLYLIVIAWPRTVEAARGPIEERQDAYLGLADWLREHVREDERVAVTEVGCVGYFGERRILDLCGLVSPEIVPFLRERDLPGGLFALRPEWYVLINEFAWIDGAAVRDPRFLRQYEKVTEMPGPWASPIFVYRRRDLAAGR